MSDHGTESLGRTERAEGAGEGLAVSRCHAALVALSWELLDGGGGDAGHPLTTPRLAPCSASPGSPGLDAPDVAERQHLQLG